MTALSKLLRQNKENIKNYMKGFDKKTYYHGTTEDIQEFDNRSFFTDDPEEASMYATGEAFARDIDVEGALEGARVYPVKLKTDFIFDVDNKEHKEIIDELGAEMGYPNASADIETTIFGVGSDNVDADELQELLELAGFNGVKDRFAASEGGVIENVVLFNPDGKVRSVNAKFDPQQSGSGNIMANVAGATTLGALSGLEDGT